jgi:S1-C subfamily serine protease
MYREKHNYRSDTWRHRFSRIILSGMVCLALLSMITVVSGVPAAYAAGPGGNVSDPVVRAVDIAKPAVVRIITQVVGQLTVNFSSGRSVTFPQAPQQGFNGYPLDFSGTGAFISAHGDILTADHVVNPVQDDRTALDQALQQAASQDVANYINQNLKPAQQATPDQVTQQLNSGQLPSNSQYDQPKSRVYLSVEFTGPLNAPDFQSIPASQYANVDQIKQHSPFDALDTAIIHVSGMDNMPMLQLDDSSAVQQQDQLTIIGFPGNGDVSTAPTDFLTPSINVIYVSAMKTFNGSPVIQVGGNVEQGDSGGPALDSHGKVVGIVSFGSVATQGSTSFLRASNSAKQLIQSAGIDTTPSALQQSWSKAFNDYAATTPGHWHKAAQEFQQIVNQYPTFQAVGPFLQYAKQQAATEPQTQGTNPTSPGVPATSNSGGLNPLYIVIGGGAVLIILLLGGLAVSRRRKPALAAPAMMGGYTTPSAPGYPQAPGQSYGAPPVTPGVSQPQPRQNVSTVIPQTPVHPGQSAYQQPGGYGSRANYQSQPAASQQGYRPQPSPASGMAAFGAPSAPNVPGTPQPTSAAPDATLVARPNTPSSQWRTWPCGHTNRFDARFCGTCGEPAPPVPIVRRVEQ